MKSQGYPCDFKSCQNTPHSIPPPMASRCGQIPARREGVLHFHTIPPFSFKRKIRSFQRTPQIHEPFERNLVLLCPEKWAPHSKDLHISHLHFINTNREMMNLHGFCCRTAFLPVFAAMYPACRTTFWAVRTIAYEIRGGVKQNGIRPEEQCLFPVM